MRVLACACVLAQPKPGTEMGKHFNISVATVRYARDAAGRFARLPFEFDEPIALECLLIRGDGRVWNNAASQRVFPPDHSGKSLHPMVQGNRPFRIGRYPVDNRHTGKQEIVQMSMADEKFGLPRSTGWHDLNSQFDRKRYYMGDVCLLVRPSDASVRARYPSLYNISKPFWIKPDSWMRQHKQLDVRHPQQAVREERQHEAQVRSCLNALIGKLEEPASRKRKQAVAESSAAAAIDADVLTKLPESTEAPSYKKGIRVEVDFGVDGWYAGVVVNVNKGNKKNKKDTYDVILDGYETPEAGDSKALEYGDLRPEPASRKHKQPPVAASSAAAATDADVLTLTKRRKGKEPAASDSAQQPRGGPSSSGEAAGRHRLSSRQEALAAEFAEVKKGVDRQKQSEQEVLEAQQHALDQLRRIPAKGAAPQRRAEFEAAAAARAEEQRAAREEAMAKPLAEAQKALADAVGLKDSQALLDAGAHTATLCDLLKHFEPKEEEVKGAEMQEAERRKVNRGISELELLRNPRYRGKPLSEKESELDEEQKSRLRSLVQNLVGSVSIEYPKRTGEPGHSTPALPEWVSEKKRGRPADDGSVSEGGDAKVPTFLVQYDLMKALQALQLKFTDKPEEMQDVTRRCTLKSHRRMMSPPDPPKPKGSSSGMPPPAEAATAAVPVGFHFESYPMDRLVGPTPEDGWFYINNGKAFPEGGHVASGFVPRLHQHPYVKAVFDDLFNITKGNGLYGGESKGYFAQRLFCEGTCTVVLERRPGLPGEKPLVVAAACCKVMASTGELPCLYIKTFISNKKELEQPQNRMLADAFKDGSSGRSLLGKELLAQVCALVGRGVPLAAGGSGAALASEGAVKGHVFAQCVLDAGSGEAFWKKTPLTRDTEAEYVTAQVATHSLAMEQTWLEHPELYTKKIKGTNPVLYEANNQCMEVDLSCEMRHAPIVGRAKPRELHLNCSMEFA